MVTQLFLLGQYCLSLTFPWAPHNLQGGPPLPAFASGPGQGRLGDWAHRHAVCWNPNLCFVLFALFFVLLQPGAETPARMLRRGPLPDCLSSRERRVSLEQRAWVAKGCSPHVWSPENFFSLDPIWPSFPDYRLVLSLWDLSLGVHPLPQVVHPCVAGCELWGPDPSTVFPEGSPIPGKCSLETSRPPKETTDMARLKNPTGNLLLCNLAGLSVSEQWWGQC